MWVAAAKEFVHIHQAIAAKVPSIYGKYALYLPGSFRAGATGAVVATNYTELGHISPIHAFLHATMYL